jgi:uncharacterized membrane protein YphA (DoxX/SURF4 family)
LKLQRLFPAFPDGRPGAGLLLLRIAVGGAAVVESGLFFNSAGTSTLATWAAGGLAATAGACLLSGFLTPIAASLVVLSNLAVLLSWLPAAPDLLQTKLPVAFLIVVSAAVACLGPGAYSIDARLFGRREIIDTPGNTDEASSDWRTTLDALS